MTARLVVASIGLLVSLVCAMAASGQTWTGTPARGGESVEPGSPAGHGWMTIRDDRDQSTILLHLPPRTTGGDEVGAVRIAPGVSGQTDAIASFGNRVWLALAVEPGPTDMLRRMVTLSAQRSVGGTWDYPPGRPEVLPPLAGRDELVGFVGTARGPVALTRARGERAEMGPTGDWTIQVLGQTQWHAISLPWTDDADGPAPDATVRLVSMDDGAVGILSFRAGAEAVEVFRAEIPGELSVPEGEVASAVWERSLWPIAGLSGSQSGFIPDWVAMVGDDRTQQLIAVRWMGDDELEVVGLRPSGAAELTTIKGVPRPFRVCALNATASVAVLWWEASGKKTDGEQALLGSTAARKFSIIEVSGTSGKELYRGEHKGGGLFSGTEFKVLSVALLLVTTIVLLFALRAEPTARMLLPEGFSPADPLRRIFAAAADLVPGVVLAAFAMGLEPGTMLSPAVLIGPTAEPLAWALALGLTIVLCTLGEATTGRSIGKALTGCEVASLRTNVETGKLELGPVTVWQALVRNAIRWGVPVLGILLFIDGGRRHPADAAARTVVVVREDEPDEE